MNLISRIIFFVVMIFAAFFILTITLGPEGLLAKTRVGIDKIDFNPTENLTLGEKISIPEVHVNEINSLNNTIIKMMSSTKNNCFANYGGFTELGEGGTSIIMNYNSQKGSTQFMIMGGAGGKQVATDLLFEIEGMIPCVIAGNKNVVQNFDSSFLNILPLKQKTIVPNHYLAVQEIKIFYNTDGRNGNHIEVPQFGRDIVNDEGNNFLDAGMLYTPDNKHICFFPTVYGDSVCNGGDAEGIDDDCLGEDSTEDIAIPQQFSERKLIACTN